MAQLDSGRTNSTMERDSHEKMSAFPPFLKGMVTTLVVLLLALLTTHEVQSVQVHDDYVNGQQFRAKFLFWHGDRIVDRHALLTICAKEAFSRYDGGGWRLAVSKDYQHFREGCFGEPQGSSYGSD